MTYNEERAVHTSRRRHSSALRGVFTSSSEKNSRHRIELHDTFRVQMPDSVEGSRAVEDPCDPELLRHDGGLRDAILLEGFDGFTWAELLPELARYGIATMSAWIITGEIYKKAGAAGRPVRPPEDPFDPDERTSLAHDTVVAGLALFRKDGLEAGRWDPAAGASLATYFIGACVLSFSNVLRRHLTERANTANSSPTVDEVFDVPALALPSTERVVLGKMRAWAAFSRVSNEVIQKAMLFQAAGYSFVEIAELLTHEHKQFSADAIRAMLNRQHKRSADDERDGDRHV